MKKSLLLIIAIALVVIAYNTFTVEVDYEVSTEEYIPIESDGGIGDGAEPLVVEEVNEDPEDRRIPEEYICVGEYCDGSMSGENDFTVVNIPIIIGEGDIGCGAGLMFSPHIVKPKTLAVLDATYTKLFNLKPSPELPGDNIRNIVGTEDLLFYEGVSLDNNGVAKVQLSGTAYHIYNCSIPEFKVQIEQSALQFDAVNSIEVYKNGELWDWCEYEQADLEESGCGINRKYWITSK